MERARTGEPVRVPGAVLDGIEAVRRSGILNMLQAGDVAAACRLMGHGEAGDWVIDHRAEYARGVLAGFTAENEEDDDA